MTLFKINRSPSIRQLRQFGLICTIALPLLGWFAHATAEQLLGLTLIGTAVASLVWIWPAAIRPVFVTLTMLTAPIGMILAELSLLAIYIGVFLPIGIVFRLMGRNALQLKLDRQAKSYWQDKSEPKDTASYYRKF